MSLILATTYPDVIAAAGVHSATAYRSATQGFSALGAMAAHGSMPDHELIGGEMAPVVVIQGTNDSVVRAPNGDRIVDQWLASREAAALTGLDRVRPLATTRALVVDGRRCIRTRWYTARGRRVLEYWRIDGLRHAWSGGTRKAAFVDPTGPPAAEVMASFFQRHRLPQGTGSPGAAATEGGGKAVKEVRNKVEAKAAESRASETVTSFPARMKVAREFYEKAGFSQERTADHLKGIDFSKPVEVVTLEPSAKVIQYQRTGHNFGNYLAPPGTEASALGVNPAGRVATTYEVTRPVQVLRSTAAPVEDIWSAPGEVFKANGGGIQYFTTEGGAFKAVN